MAFGVPNFSIGSDSEHLYSNFEPIFFPYKFTFFHEPVANKER